MDFGALPPEINSGRMYSGPGCGSMLGAAAAWDGTGRRLAFHGGLLSVGDRGPDRRSMAGSLVGVDGDRGDAVHRVDDDDCCAVRANSQQCQGRRSRLRGRVCRDGAASDDRSQPRAADGADRDKLPRPKHPGDRGHRSPLRRNVGPRMPPPCMSMPPRPLLLRRYRLSPAAAHHKSSRGRRPGCCELPTPAPHQPARGLRPSCRRARSCCRQYPMHSRDLRLHRPPGQPSHFAIAELTEPGEPDRCISVDGHHVDGHGRVVCGPGICGALRPGWCRQAGCHTGALGGGSRRLGNECVGVNGFGRSRRRQRVGTCVVSGFRPGLLNRRAVGAAGLGRSHLADKTRRRGMAEYPLRCHPDSPRSESGKSGQRNAFGECGSTRRWRWCHSEPAHGHQNCAAAPAGCRQLGLTPAGCGEAPLMLADPPSDDFCTHPGELARRVMTTHPAPMNA